MRRQRRDQVKELEHEPDLLAAQLRQGVLAERGDVDAVDHDRARRRRIEAGEQPEQRRLAAAGRTDDGHELPARDRRREGVENGQRLGAARDRLRNRRAVRS